MAETLTTTTATTETVRVVGPSDNVTYVNPEPRPGSTYTIVADLPAPTKERPSR
jgi:hypothetical protein